MRRIKNRDIKQFKVGTRLYDRYVKEWVPITRIDGNYIVVGLLIEDAESIKRCYMI